MIGAPSVFVCAGEVSGDRAAAAVVVELRARFPRLRCWGVGGAALEAAGVELIARSEALAVAGLSEAVGLLPRLAGLRWRLRRAWRLRRPDLALLVDYPGLNLRLACALRRAAVPVLYYVAPQRWAWREGGAARVGRCTDALAVVLPFEAPWYARRGVAATFVGHPALDTRSTLPREATRRALGIEGARAVVAIFPGSRRHELERHLPPLRRAFARLPGVEPLLVPATAALAARCRTLVPAWRQAGTRQALAAADAALCKAGTVTLEVALAGIPLAAFYRLSAFSYALLRRAVKVPYVALPNILARAPVVPELLQHELTPEAIVAVVSRLLQPRYAAWQRARLGQLAALLGPPGAARRVADLAQQLLGSGA
ncbi:MAG: lipid-A-disaccharide synthase [Proteobacteria bacterium]|nr:lipid-A-disaccharide synthase [Pseudomonadota bacterium]